MNARTDRRVRVLIVDDSALVRRVLTELLSRDRGVEVVGTAGQTRVRIELPSD